MGVIPFRPLPGHSFVEDYIKAYYLSEDDTEEWLRKHPVCTNLCIKKLQASPFYSPLLMVAMYVRTCMNVIVMCEIYVLYKSFDTAEY